MRSSVSCGGVVAVPGGGGSGSGPTPSDSVVAETAAGQAAAAGAAATYARGDHTHGTPADPIPAHVAAGDPHPQYTTAAEVDAALDAALVDHVAAADPHPGYQRESEKGAASGYAELDAGAVLPLSRLPGHAAAHQNGGGDELNVGGLSGVLADPQPPAGHQAAHVTGADQIPTFGAAARGLVPASGGGTANFLRADGAFAAPPGGGGGLAFQEADRATDLALTTSYVAAVSLALGAGTWLVFGQTSIESTSTTQSNVSARLRDTTNSVTHAIAEGEVDSALPDRCNLAVHAVIVLAATATIALEGRQSAGTSHMIGPGNLGDTATKVTRLTAVQLA